MRQLAELAPTWPRPLHNAPEHIARLTREGTWELLKSAPGVMMPMNAAISRADLTRIAQGALVVEDVLGGAAFPIIVASLAQHRLERPENLTHLRRLVRKQVGRIHRMHDWPDERPLVPRKRGPRATYLGLDFTLDSRLRGNERNAVKQGSSPA